MGSVYYPRAPTRVGVFKRDARGILRYLARALGADPLIRFSLRRRVLELDNYLLMRLALASRVPSIRASTIHSIDASRCFEYIYIFLLGRRFESHEDPELNATAAFFSITPEELISRRRLRGRGNNCEGHRSSGFTPVDSGWWDSTLRSSLAGAHPALADVTHEHAWVFV